MKTVVDVILIAMWAAAYLAVVHGVGHYRHARARTLGIVGANEYRAEKDAALWLVALLAGTLLGAVVYVATTAMGQPR